MATQVAIGLRIRHRYNFNPKQFLCLNDNYRKRFPGTHYFNDVFFARNKIQIGMNVPEYLHRSGTLAICPIDNSKFLKWSSLAFPGQRHVTLMDDSFTFVTIMACRENETIVRFLEIPIQDLGRETPPEGRQLPSLVLSIKDHRIMSSSASEISSLVWNIVVPVGPTVHEDRLMSVPKLQVKQVRVSMPLVRTELDQKPLALRIIVKRPKSALWEKGEGAS